MAEQSEPVSVVRAEEELRVEVTRAAYERVVVRRRIVTDTQTVTILLRREELTVERVPLDGDDETDADDTTPQGDDRDLVVELAAEVPRVIVETRPSERVRVRVVEVREDRQLRAELGREVVAVDEDP